jgi:hypothetical protein
MNPELATMNKSMTTYNAKSKNKPMASTFWSAKASKIPTKGGASRSILSRQQT